MLDMLTTPQQGLRERKSRLRRVKEREESRELPNSIIHVCPPTPSRWRLPSLRSRFDVVQGYMCGKHLYYNWILHLRSGLVATHDLVRVGAGTVCITLVHDRYTLKLVDKVLDTTVDLSSLGAA
jgi:hypothetical protein